MAYAGRADAARVGGNVQAIGGTVQEIGGTALELGETPLQMGQRSRRLGQSPPRLGRRRRKSGKRRLAWGKGSAGWGNRSYEAWAPGSEGSKTRAPRLSADGVAPHPRPCIYTLGAARRPPGDGEPLSQGNPAREI